MQINLSTDNHIEGNAKLTGYVESLVESALDRFLKQITRVEVHLSDQNSGTKSGANDKRCVMEARISGRQPLSVTAESDSVDRALDGAITKLEKKLASEFDRIKDPRRKVRDYPEVDENL
ncbi:HPF/RaiA family ribosome-associated protein [Bythopirellula polymerisocia]|uniref:Sigma 54 modulation protein / S30EA ribosomal protein n=1 Tax=Bythopirellula polymerisocia TaxID=2528003 RepID=A0A5C6D221_9BACT|nr:HPF/RaiA family ribosome-associated protein [Bythopirellula polymerisocia]TWU29697.1 Sigma 54 modulation protein / S30EA ribosomal protein [Bythopirellula polymerisocia]